MSQTLTVLGGISVADRIAAGRYKCVYGPFTEENFPHDPTLVGEWEWKIFYFEGRMSSDQAFMAMVTDGWWPAKLEHVLAFGEKHPDEQCQLVIGLGSSCIMGGAKGVPSLETRAAKRNLVLCGWDPGWVNAHFLAVRKKV